MTSIDTIRANLLATAASIGTAQREEQGRFDDMANRAKDSKAQASKIVQDASRKAGGFATPRFMGLARMGEAFATASLNNPHDSIGVRLAEDMVVSYVATFTAATVKSKAGGTEAGMARVVRCGAEAPRIIEALQQRLNHWQQIRDSADESEDKAGAKAERDNADTFLVLADSAKRDDKGIVVKPAKWRGRPAATVRGIDIAAGAGTNRTSQLAQLAALYIQHGSDALMPDVVDALLNNGGRADKPAPGLADVAAKAKDAVNAIMVEFGGAESRDSATLNMMLAFLDRVAAQGLAANVGTVAQAPAIPLPTPTVQPSSPVAETLRSLPEAEDDTDSAADALLGVTDDTAEVVANMEREAESTPARNARTVQRNRGNRSNRAGLMS